MNVSYPASKPMSDANPARFLILMAVAAAAFVGCHDRNSTKTTSLESKPGVAETASATKDHEPIASPDKRKAIAVKAKDALFTRLSGRLMEVMQSDGPAAAINVCSNEAVTIAESVGEEHGVEIGRTSFKLRNPANAPRQWVKRFVEERVDTPQYAQLDNGSLGAIYPIRISVKCLMCHGSEDDILDAVKPELAERYPRDAATGFKLDDLRGWFWVEVPGDATHSSDFITPGSARDGTLDGRIESR